MNLFYIIVKKEVKIYINIICLDLLRKTNRYRPITRDGQWLSQTVTEPKDETEEK
jgi:hypothetical protein